FTTSVVSPLYHCHFFLVFVIIYSSSPFLSFFLLILPPPPTPTLFPYTTLFRSRGHRPLPQDASARPPRPGLRDQSREHLSPERHGPRGHRRVPAGGRARADERCRAAKARRGLRAPRQAVSAEAAQKYSNETGSRS